MSTYLNIKKLCKLSSFTLSTMLIPEGGKSEGQHGLFVFVQDCYPFNKDQHKPYKSICLDLLLPH